MYHIYKGLLVHSRW